MQTISGNIVDILNRKIFSGEVRVENGKITKITPASEKYDAYLLPGFIDAHVHVESSMLTPSEFARLAVVHGTVAAISDPHEIGNVLGIEGIRYMIENGKKVPFKFYFGASSCVPATSFETAGGAISPEDIRKLFVEDGLHYLSEMMNYPGVLHQEPQVMEKLRIAYSLGRAIDGHAPGVKGKDIKNYITACGKIASSPIQPVITTDHETYALDEGLGKIENGMNIIIREGSAAKNYEALHTLIKTHPDKVMFCSDDKHPNDLVVSQIDEHVRRSISLGYELFDVLHAACIKPVHHYKLEVGLLRQGDPADFIVVNNLKDFKVLQTYINGLLVAEEGKTLIPSVSSQIVNNFNCSTKKPEDFALAGHEGTIRVIEAIGGSLITNELHLPAKISNGNVVSDIENDVLKLTVVERYSDGKPSVAFIRNFGLKTGAIASCVAHDSHNIIAVGVKDEDICHAVNAIVNAKGGISVADNGTTEILPLPIAGIMTNQNGYSVAEKYTRLDKLAKNLGSKLYAPFMTLSFMALTVIPNLKLSDKGLFDGSRFQLTSLYV
jgi:adenine deaminase